MNFFKKTAFLLQRPPVVLITGKEADSLGEILFKVLSPSFKVRKFSNGTLPWVFNREKVLIFKSEKIKPGVLNGLKFFLKRSKNPVLVATHLGEIPPDKYFFSGRRKDTFCMRKLAEVLPARGFCILNLDDRATKEIEGETAAKVLTFGFQRKSDIAATDLNVTSEGINFKLNYEGYTVPFWLSNVSSKSSIYNALSSAGVATALGVNLVEVSQILRDIYFVDKK